MTFLEALAAVWRHRTVMFVGLALTLVVILLSTRRTSVYLSHTQIRLVAPASTTPGIVENALISTPESVTATAGLVALRLSDGQRLPKMTSPDVTIVDAGIVNGRWIRVPDYGGQWSNDFRQPILDVQVSGEDPNDVRRRAAQALRDVETTTEQIQAEYGVPRLGQIWAQDAFGGPTLSRVGGNAAATVFALGTVGVGLSAAAALVIDGRRIRRPRPEDEPEGAPDDVSEGVPQDVPATAG